MKRIVLALLGLVGLGAIILGCSPVEPPLSITEIEILPPSGDSGTTITAYVDYEGEGTVRYQWARHIYYLYHPDSLWILAPSCYKQILSSQYHTLDSLHSSETSMTIIHPGRYQLNIYSDTSERQFYHGDYELLASSDSLWYGEEVQPPNAGFTVEPYSDSLVIYLELNHSPTFIGEDQAYCDWGDDSHPEYITKPEDWIPFGHAYDTSGTYTITLILSNLAGIDSCTKTITVPLD